MNNMEKINRWYVKCPGCLGLGVIELEHAPHGATCEQCGDTMTLMGRVQGDRYILTGEACACDDRCLGALGPQCVCSCGGKNHGKGLVAGTVTVVVASGKLVVRVIKAEEAAARRAEWEAGSVEVREAIHTAYPELAAYAAGEYLGGGGSSKWERYLDARDMLRTLRSADELKSHAGRMKRLAQIKARLAQ